VTAVLRLWVIFNRGAPSGWTASSASSPPGAQRSPAICTSTYRGGRRHLACRDTLGRLPPQLPSRVFSHVNYSSSASTYLLSQVREPSPACWRRWATGQRVVHSRRPVAGPEEVLRPALSMSTRRRGRRHDAGCCTRAAPGKVPGPCQAFRRAHSPKRRLICSSPSAKSARTTSTAANATGNRTPSTSTALSDL
jgi:hypothetical protein